MTTRAATPPVESLEEWLSERDRALTTMDMDYAAKVMPQASQEVRLMAMHKARYEATRVDAALRLESGEWLRERGFGRMTGEPFLPKGELPE